MQFWINLWTVVFFVSIALYAGLVVVVAIGGFFNIKSLFKTLAQETEPDQENADQTAD